MLKLFISCSWTIQNKDRFDRKVMRTEHQMISNFFYKFKKSCKLGCEIRSVSSMINYHFWSINVALNLSKSINKFDTTISYLTHLHVNKLHYHCNYFNESFNFKSLKMSSVRCRRTLRMFSNQTCNFILRHAPLLVHPKQGKKAAA